MSNWYYTATAAWTQDALDRQPNKMFNGYEAIPGRFSSEDEARTALAPHLLRPEIGSGRIFCLRDLRRGEVETRWRKSVDKPGHTDTKLQAMVREATTLPDGTDYLDR